MPIQLDAAEARILGSLVEKALATPEQYPLTFHALTAACNQKTSREPVMELGPDAVGRAVQKLIDKGLAERANRAGERVPKFIHRVENLLGGEKPSEVAALCVLLLRGPQTPGEIKTRAERLFRFAGTADVEALLQELCARPDDPWLARLPRQPGQKEARYQHLFSGFPAAEGAAPAPSAPTDRLSLLEGRIAALESAVAELARRGGQP